MPAAVAEHRPATAPLGAAVEAALEAALIARLEGPRYDLWFRGRTSFAFDGETLTVGVANAYSHDFLKTRFGEAVRSAVQEVYGPRVAVRFAIDAQLFQQSRAAEQAEAPPAPSRPAPQANSAEMPARPAKKLGRKFKALASFVVGACNRVAYASAVSVVEEPGQGANPLVIYGPTGTGKTHLLEGVFAGLRQQHQELRAVYVTAEEFMNRFVASMHANKQGSFRRQFRECDALILDDLNFLAGRKATLVEFLHTFDALVAEGAQIVLATDCHPRLADDLPPELVDRLLGGAVWSVLPPDAETRLSLLKSKSAQGSPAIPEGVLVYIAKHLRGNVRELEGAIHSLRHFARVSGRPVDEAMAREALGDLLRHAVKAVVLADVDAAVCAVLRLPANGLRSKAKSWGISHPRMIAIYLARKHTTATYGEIALFYGNKTHSTAVAGEKRVRQWLSDKASVKCGEREWGVQELVERVERELGK